MATKTADQRAEQLETLAKVEDAMYRARSEFQGPTFRSARTVEESLIGLMLQAKAQIDSVIDLIERRRREITGRDE